MTVREAAVQVSIKQYFAANVEHLIEVCDGTGKYTEPSCAENKKDNEVVVKLELW